MAIACQHAWAFDFSIWQLFDFARLSAVTIEVETFIILFFDRFLCSIYEKV